MNEEKNLRYEETPIIDPQSVTPEASQIFREKPEAEHPVMRSDSIPPKPVKKKSRVGTILFVLILFGLGIWLAGQLRSFFIPEVSEDVSVPTAGAAPTIRPTLAHASPSAALSWQTYEVISSATKKPLAGISYQLPGNVKASSCDSTRCASSGTNLGGGTRFTVAARGKGQLLPDFRGAILTDATGREFTMQQKMVGGRYVYEYVGDFTGRTGGGYTFTKIRGVLVPVSDTLAIEFNHFAPAGVETDFAADDAVFDAVIKSFTATGYSVSSPTVKPTVQPTVSLPTATPATGSGF